MTADAAPIPAVARASMLTRRMGLAGLATLWFVLPFMTALASSLVPVLATLGAALVLIPILVDDARRGAPRRALGLDDVGVVLFFGGALFATFGPQAVVDRWTCIMRLAQIGGFAAFYYGVLGQLRRDVDGSFARGALRLGAAAAFVQIGYAIVEFVRRADDRLTSPAFNPNFFASYLIAWTIVFVPGWLARKGGVKRVIVAALGLAPLLIATGSKFGVLFFAFLVLLLLVGETRIGFTRSALLVLLVLTAAFSIPNPLRTRILASETNQVYPRRFYYEVAFENLKEHPLGIGPGMNKFHFAKKAFYEPEPSYLHRRREVGLVHNVFLGSTLETGVLGGLGVLLFVVAFVRRGLARRGRVSPLAAGAFAAAALLWLHLQVDGLSQSSVMMSTLFFFVAIVRSESEARTKQRRGFALPRVVAAALAVGVLLLSWPGVVSAVEANFVKAGDDALVAMDPRLAFVSYQRAVEIAPLDTKPRIKSVEALLYVFDATLDPTLVQRLAVEAQSASALNPLDPEPLLLTARALISVHSKLDPGREAQMLDRAEVFMQRALELDPLDVETRFAHAHVLQFLARTDEAIEEIQSAIAYEKNYVQAYSFLAELLEGRGDFDGAAAAKLEAIRAYYECVEIAFKSRFGPVRFFQQQLEDFDPLEAKNEVRRLKNHIHK